ncbi:MAG: isoprenylcysteine carboxylmethyltransferase family protein [Planctomycetes bacterium]|nr:isoprenylcysteine carboxylmethyltransferase family protein [Planctomycetota bacterium]
MNVTEIVVLAAYASLVVELVLFPIPSEASTWQLLAAETPANAPAGDALLRARSRPLAQKILRLFLPTALGVVSWLLPLGCILVPGFAAAVWSTSVPWLQAPGLALVVLGRAVTFASVLQLRAQRRRGAAPGWLFRRSRNPGLVGMFTCYLGLCCLFGSPLLWLGLPLYVGNMHGRVRMEEAHLSRRLGAAWTDYAARVPRYLGW